METTNTRSLMDALMKVQQALPAAQANQVNGHLKNKYADLAAVQAVCRPLLLEQGLVVTHTSKTEPNGSITVTAVMTHVGTGQFITSEVTMKPQQDTPQGVGSCMTYGRRYTLAAMVGIVVDEDDDGNAGSRQPKPAPESKDQQKQKGLMEKVRVAFKAYTGTDKAEINKQLATEAGTNRLNLKFWEEMLFKLTPEPVETPGTDADA